MKKVLIHTLKRSDLTRLSPAVSLTLIYLTLSILWILLSDSLATRIAGDNMPVLEKIQEFEGLIFVLLSAGVLYFLSRGFYRNMLNSFRQKESLEQKFMALNEAAREGIFDCDLESRKAQLNSKMRFFLPTPCNEIENFWQAYQGRIHPEDMPHFTEEYTEIISSRRSNWQLEYRLLGSDNKYYTVASNIYILRNTQTGQPTRLIGAIQDVSDLRNLQAEKYESELKHKRRLAVSIIRAQENERNRWAQELHDNVCQMLSVAKLYLREMNNRPGSLPVLLPEVTKMVSDAMLEIRQLSANIRPPSFSETTLQQSLEKLAADINRVKEIKFNFSINDITEIKLCDEQKLMIYRIVQEQLNNIIKYAEANKVEINLDQAKEMINIIVKDDGKGFDPSCIKTGIGLRNIQSRLQFYKGNMHIESSPGHGCVLSAAFKLQAS
ncbi:MAG: histidine kinase [Bacteroidota bacterium]|nr:histidine kinase [Bacteroidota bacterium]